ncbi:hypothetical protein DL96DRAFT_1577926 [Flagelloscypha sp. PMI_526]|nr:hypothetical protein DL96DRAFT_1577926 [Flagelloscypha sp. PMI_526]
MFIHEVGVKRFTSFVRLRRIHVKSGQMETLDRWRNSSLGFTLDDTPNHEKLLDLFITLPTRDGSTRPPVPSKNHLEYGHHLVFFHPRTREGQLRTDATDPDFAPPSPWTRRMWAGGKFTWVGPPLRLGSESGNHMAFLRQQYSYSQEHSSVPSIIEERTHVFLPVSAATPGERPLKEVKGLIEPFDFEFIYTPSPTTLFRFSALTFNAHQIHLDKEYAQEIEGYPERLVHGPLTALMMIESVLLHHPGARLYEFTYRAQNPLPVGRPCAIRGKWQDPSTITLWALDESAPSVVMTGTMTVLHDNAFRPTPLD